MPRNPIFFVALLAMLLVLPGLGNRDFSTRGEPREALVAQSIAEGDSAGHLDWVLGTGYGGSVPSKPPLTHWITALVSYPLGEVTPATARFPSALACILAVTFFGGFVARRFGAYRGLVTAVVLLTSVEWFRASFAARVDMTLAATLMGGLLAVYQWEERKRTSFPWLAIAMFSLAALTKGPVAIALPGFIFVLLLLKHKESPFQILRSGLVLFAPVLFVVGLWYLAAFLERRDAFLDKVWYENVQRFLGTQEDEPHKNSVLYLWASLIIGLIPWSFILLGWCAAAWKGLGEVVRVPQSLVVRVRTWWSRLDPFERYSFLVLASFLLFFSIPGSKRSVYLLPAYPFAAFLLSGFFDARALTSLRAQRMLACTLSSTTLVLAGLIALVLNFPELVLSRLHGKSAAVDASFFIEAFSQYFISASVWEWGAVIALMLLAVGVLAASFPLGARLPVLGQKPFLALATLICALCAVGNWVLFPPAVNGLSSRDFADAVSAVASEEDTLYSFDTEFYGLSFYAKRPVYRYEERKPTTGLLLLNETDLPDFRGQVGGQILISPLLRSATPITRPRDYVLLVRLAPISTSGIGFGSH